VVWVGAAQAVVEVEPFVLLAGVDAVVGGKPTASAGMADAAGRWGEEKGTPPYTSVGHYWMRLSWPSSSCPPCVRGSYHPR
jgi:hypothetical protein